MQDVYEILNPRSVLTAEVGLRNSILPLADAQFMDQTAAHALIVSNAIIVELLSHGTICDQGKPRQYSAPPR